MITIKKAKGELAELKDVLKSIDSKIREVGGPKSQSWLFFTRYKIRGLEKKIEDMKVGKIRTDKIPSEGIELEKRISNLEDSLGKTIKGGK